MNVFFVCGAPKSGTTWLQRILDAHPQVVCGGEGHFISRFTIPVAKIVNDYNEAMATENRLVYEGRPYYGPVDQAEYDDVARNFVLNRLKSLKPGPQVLWVGDKTPRYTAYLKQLHRLFPEARIISILRDPRDVVVSRMGYNRRAGRSEVFVQGSDQHEATLQGALRTWREAVTLVDEFAAANPGLAHEVRYLDLHEDGPAAAARMFGFLGVDAGPQVVDKALAAASFEALTGRKPGEEDPDAFLRQGLPGDWKNRLDPATVRTVLESCGELMRAKGMI